MKEKNSKDLLFEINFSDAFMDNTAKTESLDARMEGMFIWELIRLDIPINKIFEEVKNDKDYFTKLCLNYSELCGLSSLKLTTVASDRKLKYKGEYTPDQTNKLNKLGAYLYFADKNREKAFEELEELIKFKMENTM